MIALCVRFQHLFTDVKENPLFGSAEQYCETGNSLEMALHILSPVQRLEHFGMLLQEFREEHRKRKSTSETNRAIGAIP